MKGPTDSRGGGGGGGGGGRGGEGGRGGVGGRGGEGGGSETRLDENFDVEEPSFFLVAKSSGKSPRLNYVSYKALMDHQSDTDMRLNGLRTQR